MYFLWILHNSKAYKLFDPVSGRVIFSRIVIFTEKERWTWREYEEGLIQVKDILVDEGKQNEIRETYFR